MQHENYIYGQSEHNRTEMVCCDAEGKTLGRLAAEVAKVLRGKNKPTFTPHVDTGDHVIVVNAEKIRVTGKKLEQKEYFRHSGYPGGARFTKLSMMLKNNLNVL